MATGELIERGPALAVLADAAAAARRGEGSVVLVGGEAGVGKTSLVRRFASEVTGRMRVLSGGCDALSTPRPLAPLLDMAADLGAAFRAELAGAARREVLFETFLASLRHAVAPALVVLEDLHWADDATLDLVRYLGRRVGEVRAIVVITYRDDEVGPSHPLRVAIGDIASGVVLRRVALEPLSPAGVTQLALGRGVEAALLHRVTGGNPFFVSELLVHGGATLPPSVQDAVAARVARLPSEARSALERASVLGLEAPRSRLVAIGASPEGLATCLERGLLVERADRLSFRHQLARDAVYASVPAGMRRALHATAFAALEREPTPVDVADLAHHAAEAGEGDAVLRLAPVAGQRAAAVGAHRLAHAQFERALAYRDRLDGRARAELLEAFSVECDVLDRAEEAKAALLEALELRRALGDTEELGSGLTRLASLHVGLAENAESDAAIAEALSVLSPLPRGAAWSRAATARAIMAMLDRRLDDAVAFGAEALSVAEALGEPRGIARALLALGASQLMAERPGARETLERSRELASRHGLHDIVLNVVGNLGSGLGELHAFDEAERALRQAIAYGEEHELYSSPRYAISWLALVRMYRGDYLEARELAERAIGWRSAGITTIMALVALGRLQTRRGDPEAWETLDAALRQASTTKTLQRLAPVRAARAEAHALAGRSADAAAEAEAVYALAVDRRHAWFVAELGYWRALGGHDVTLPTFAAVPFALEVAGRYEEAAAAWEALGCPYEAARARLASGEEGSMRSAHAAFVELGAAPAAGLAAQRLRAIGARGVPRGPGRAASAHPAGLTPREAEVLRGVVEGLQNAEIALKHGVSTRTVDHQVSAVLAKLGVRTRAEAIVEAHRLEGRTAS
jgi:DNA-binding CsgD family transcriptional regulator/tetratricopeptide (TPR) repeat protein